MSTTRKIILNLIDAREFFTKLRNQNQSLDSFLKSNAAYSAPLDQFERNFTKSTQEIPNVASFHALLEKIFSNGVVTEIENAEKSWAILREMFGTELTEANLRVKFGENLYVYQTEAMTLSAMDENPEQLKQLQAKIEKMHSSKRIIDSSGDMLNSLIDKLDKYFKQHPNLEQVFVNDLPPLLEVAKKWQANSISDDLNKIAFLMRNLREETAPEIVIANTLKTINHRMFNADKKLRLNKDASLASLQQGLKDLNKDYNEYFDCLNLYISSLKKYESVDGKKISYLPQFELRIKAINEEVAKLIVLINQKIEQEISDKSLLTKLKNYIETFPWEIGRQSDHTTIDVAGVPKPVPRHVKIFHEHILAAENSTLSFSSAKAEIVKVGGEAYLQNDKWFFNTRAETTKSFYTLFASQNEIALKLELDTYASPRL